MTYNLTQLKSQALKRGIKYMTSENSNLSDYELSCGCYEYAHVNMPYEQPLSTKLFKEHSVYHVVIHDYETGIRQQWNSFNTLTEARKAFNRSKKAIINLKLWDLEKA